MPPKRKPASTAIRVGDLMKLLDVGEATVYRWKREGCPVEDREGALWFEPAAVKEWLAAKNRKPGQRGRPSEVDGASDNQKDRLAEAKIRKELALAERAELDVAERKGEVVARAEVEAVTIQRILAVKAALTALPAREAPMLVGRDQREIQTHLDASVRVVLAGFAGGLKQFTEVGQGEAR